MALKLFKDNYPEFVKNNKIMYPIEDSLLRTMPELHEYSAVPKPIPAPISDEESAADILEIWNFCMIFKSVLRIGTFTLAELQLALNSENEEDSCLVTHLIQAFVDEYVKDVKKFNEKDLYTSFAILLLEMSDNLYMCPIEATSLIFKIKKYRRCISLPSLNNI